MSATYPTERALGTPAVDSAALTSESAVSWAAIFAGAVTAAAISIMLLVFGAGLGLSSISPWPHDGVSATTFTVLAAIWLVIVQWLSSALGGYISGRMRSKWKGLHTDEVFFRDTAHGFLAWALSTVLVAGMLSLGTHTATTAGAQLAGNAASTGLSSTANNYYVDELFRQNVLATGAIAPSNGSGALVTGLSDKDVRSQASAILAESTANGGTLPAADNAYLVQLVSGRTGLAPADAQTRVNDVENQVQAAIVKAKQVANAARKASAEAAIYTFVSLLIGAFIASVAGAIGGRLRDNY